MGLFSGTIHATPLGQVIALEGKVYFRDRLLEIKDTLVDNGQIKTGKEGWIEVYVDKWNSILFIGSDSILDIRLWGGDRSHYRLVKGFCRWKERKGKDTKQLEPFQIHTPNATVSGKKAGFLLFYNPVLEETQIVIQEGESFFYSRKDVNDRRVVGKNHWVGTGGRFGDAVAEPLVLSPSGLEYFRRK